MSEEIQETAIEMTQRIYDAYSSDTGVLFGIPHARRGAVQSIVLCVLENIKCSDTGVVLK